MSDGPVKLSPDAPPLDDIILGDDDHTVPMPIHGPRSSVAVPSVLPSIAPSSIAPGASVPPGGVGGSSGDDARSKEGEDRPTTRRERSSNRIKTAEASKDAAKDAARDPARESRRRQKMTLRIPDDEVSRPQLPATTPTGGVPAVSASRPPSAPEFGSRPPSDPDPLEVFAPLRPNRIISIGTPAPEEGTAHGFEADAHNSPSRAPGIDASQEEGWTPYQPQVADRTPSSSSDLGGERIVSHGHDAAAAAARVAMRDPLHTILDEPGMGAMGVMMHEARAREEQSPVSEDIPIDTDEEEEQITRDRSDELTTNPRLPAAADSEDIKIEDGERHTDPGELPDEIGAEDLVSVESIPSPHSPHAPPPLKGGGIKLGITPAPGVTATSLMSGGQPAGAPGQAGPLFDPRAPGPLGAPFTMAAPLVPAGIAPIASPVQLGVQVGVASGAGKSPSAPPPQYVPQQVHQQPQQPPAQVPHAHPSQPAPPAHPSQPAPPQSQQHQQAAQPQYIPQQPAQQQYAQQHAAQQHAAQQQQQPYAPQEIEPPPDPNPPAGTPMARRQQPAGGPFGFMPQVGALAPPAMNESAAHRKKTRPWWEDLFNDDFIRTMAKITDADIAREANFIEESLGCEAGATILDLACGTGRHAVELAQRGYQVVGFDLSLAMLARASDEAQDRKQKINFVQGDMREMTFEETFDGVFSWNTSFGYFDEEKNAAVIAKVHRALKKGGQFLLDVVNRDNLIRSAPSLAWFEGDGCICMDEMQIDFITSRMRVKRTLMMDDGRTKEIEYSIRVYSLHELGKMLHDNGFRVAEVSGRTGTPGVFFGCESPRTLILAEKR